MSTIRICNKDWSKILEFLRTCSNVRIGKESDCRRFVEGVLWIMRSGAQWRLLPADYGKWNSVYKRFARWSDNCIWQQMHRQFIAEPDMEYLMLDSTIVRAHPCASGALRLHGGQAEQALGRSRGGFSTKIHVSVDGLGNPLDFILTGGQRHDVTQAKALLAEHKSAYVLADRSYDSSGFLEAIQASGATPVIPPHPRRIEQREYDKHLYKERHLVECFIGKIKHYRRVFSRFDKLAKRYLSFLCFVGALIWLR